MNGRELPGFVWAQARGHTGFLTGLLAAFLLGSYLATAGNPILLGLSLAIYILATAIFFRPLFGVYLFLFLLLNFSSSPFLRAQPIVLGPLILPSPLMGITLLTIALGLVRRVRTRRRLRLWEPSWMGLFLIILVAQVGFAFAGHGNGTEIVRLTSVVQGLAAFPLVVLVVNRRSKVRRVLRCLALSYLLYAFSNLMISLGRGQGYRALESGSDYSVSAATTVAALLNLFIPIALGAFLTERNPVWRKVWVAAIVVTTVLSMLTATRGGLLGLTLSVLAWIILGRSYLSRRLLVGLGAVCLAVLIINSTFSYWVSTPSFVGPTSILALGFQRTMEELSGNRESGRLQMYRSAWQEILVHPLTGIGAGRVPSHSLFLGAGLDGGIWFMGLWLILFAVLLVRSFRIWRRVAQDPFWGPIALGLFISMALAFGQNCLDMMLYAVGYSLVFWLQRGIESVLKSQYRYDRVIAVPSVVATELLPARTE